MLDKQNTGLSQILFKSKSIEFVYFFVLELKQRIYWKIEKIWLCYILNKKKLLFRKFSSSKRLLIVRDKLFLYQTKRY